MRTRRESRHTVCHLGGGELSGTAYGDAGIWSGWGVQRGRWQRTWTGALPCEGWGRWGPVGRRQAL